MPEQVTDGINAVRVRWARAVKALPDAEKKLARPSASEAAFFDAFSNLRECLWRFRDQHCKEHEVAEAARLLVQLGLEGWEDLDSAGSGLLSGQFCNQ